MEVSGFTPTLKGVSVPTCAVVLVAALLAGCKPATEPPMRPEGDPVAYVGGFVNKLCDHGRAVYAHVNGGVAVVPAAPECARTAAETGSVGTEASAGVNPK